MQIDVGSNSSSASPVQGRTDLSTEEKKIDSSESLPSSPFKTIASYASRALEFFSDNPAAGGSPYPSPNPRTAEGVGSNN